jgi:hypothetical protein
MKTQASRLDWQVHSALPTAARRTRPTLGENPFLRAERAAMVPVREIRKTWGPEDNMSFSRRHVGFTALAIALVGAGGGAAWMFAPTPDEVAVRAALDHYIQGHATGDGAHMRLAFNPAARLFWSNADTLATRTVDEYIARMPGKPAADEGARKRRIELVDVTGNAAVGKIVLDYPDAYIVDYMSLLKTNGEWRIINKIFMTEMKKK